MRRNETRREDMRQCKMQGEENKQYERRQNKCDKKTRID